MLHSLYALSKHGQLHVSCLLVHELHLWPQSLCSKGSTNQPWGLTLNCQPEGLACFLWAGNVILLPDLFPPLILRTKDIAMSLPSAHIELPVY